MKKYVFYVHEIAVASVAVEAETEEQARETLNSYIESDDGLYDVMQACGNDWNPDIEIMDYIDEYSGDEDPNADVNVNF